MSTLCPYCKESLRLKDNCAHGNIMTHGKSNSVLTKCCDNFVRISAQVTYTWSYHIDSSPYEFNGIQSDDWGNEKRVSK